MEKLRLKRYFNSVLPKSLGKLRRPGSTYDHLWIPGYSSKVWSLKTHSPFSNHAIPGWICDPKNKFLSKTGKRRRFNKWHERSNQAIRTYWRVRMPGFNQFSP